MIDVLRAEVGGPGPDRFLAPDIEAAVALVRVRADPRRGRERHGTAAIASRAA